MCLRHAAQWFCSHPQDAILLAFKNRGATPTFIVTLLVRVNPLHRQNFTCSVSGMKTQVQKRNTSYRHTLQLDTENMCCHIVTTSFEVGEKVVGVKRS